MDGKQQPPQYQVFINFRGVELRHNFIDHLVKAMKDSGINVFIDTDEQKGNDIQKLLMRIEESSVSLAIFSTKYTESSWCLDELVTIKKRVDLGMLEVLPIFYKVSTESVKQLVGEFGEHFRRRESEYCCKKSKIDEWKKALECVSGKIGLALDGNSSEVMFIELIIKNVLELLEKVSAKEQARKAASFGTREGAGFGTGKGAGFGFGTGGNSSSYPTNNGSGFGSVPFNSPWSGSGYSGQPGKVTHSSSISVNGVPIMSESFVWSPSPQPSVYPRPPFHPM